MASPHEGASLSQGGPLSGAADLLRQAMMSGSQRYVQIPVVFLIISPVIFPCNAATLQPCQFHMLLGVFRPAHRHWHGTAPAQSPPQQSNAAIWQFMHHGQRWVVQNDRRWQRSVRFVPRARNSGASTTLFPRFSLVPARPRLGPIASLEGRQISRAPRRSDWPCAVSKSQQLNYSLHVHCAVPPPAHHSAQSNSFLVALLALLHY
jgi:hypothetical protein